MTGDVAQSSSEGGLVLFGNPQSRASVAHWMLEEIGEPYSYRLVKFDKADSGHQKLLKLNPLGKVPTLIDDGVVITENAAICAYLADRYPNAKLAPGLDDVRRGPYLKWLFYSPSVIEPAMMQAMFDWQVPRKGMTGWGDLETVLDVVSNGLKPGPYLLGESFTTADVIIGSMLEWGMMFKAIPERPEFKDYVSRFADRPARQRRAQMSAQLGT